MFENTQGIGKIVMDGRTHLFCPMGDDWYTANIHIEIEGMETIPDYIDVTRFMEQMDGTSLIIEDACSMVHGFIVEQTHGDVTVSISVDDARHIPVTVTIGGSNA